MVTIRREVYDHAEDERVLLAPGKYLIEITDAQEKDAGEYVLIQYRTSWPNPGQVSEERFYLSEKAVKRFANLCKRLELMDRGDNPQEQLEFDVADLIGNKLVVEIDQEQKESQKTGKPYTVHKWTFAGFWLPGDPRVADFMASMQTTKRPGQKPASNGHTKLPVTDDEV